MSCVKNCTGSTDPKCIPGICPEFAKCTGSKLYKCDDQSCVSNPFLCPTRKTCNSASKVLCPDNTCANSELECREPNFCSRDQILCPDGSCINYKLNDCFANETSTVCAERKI